MGRDGVVFFFGYGVYQGLEIPPDEGPTSRTSILHAEGCMNPKIVLDQGDVIWGCECWWGLEENIREAIQESGSTVIELTIADARAGRIPHVVTPPSTDFWTA